MNYPDANHLLKKRDRKTVARANEWKALWTPSDSEVSILVKTIAAYFRNGSYGKLFV